MTPFLPLLGRPKVPPKGSEGGTDIVCHEYVSPHDAARCRMTSPHDATPQVLRLLAAGGQPLLNSLRDDYLSTMTEVASAREPAVR